MAYYTVSKPTTTYYFSSIIAIRTWLSLANQGAKTWAALSAMGLTTWKKLGAARAGFTFYYATSDPSTTYYEVT